MVEITYQMVLSTLQTIALIVGIAYYLIIMRNSQRNQQLALKAQEQSLETRQAQLFMQAFNRFSQDDMMDSVLWLYAQEPSKDWAEFEERVDGTEGGRKNAYRLIAYMEAVGVLVREGLIDIRLVALLQTGMIVDFWKKFGGVVSEGREQMDYPRMWSESEYLYDELMKYVSEHPEIKV